MKTLVTLALALGSSLLFGAECGDGIFAAGSTPPTPANSDEATLDIDENGFLRALAAAPEDANLLFIYAGWLEANDRPASAEILRIGETAARIPFGPERLEQDTRWKNVFFEALREWRSSPLGKELLKAGRIDGFTASGLPVFRPTSLISLLNLPRAFSDCIPAVDLSQQPLGVPQVRSLTLRQWPSLTALNLSGNQLPPDVVDVLNSAPFAAQLASLDLRDNLLGDRGASALAAATKLTNLRELRLGRTRITVEGARALGQSVGALQWQSLELDDNQLGNEGVKALVEGRSFAKLRLLNLARTGATEMAFRALSETKNLPVIDALIIDGNSGVGPLLSSAVLASVHYLSLASTTLTGADAIAIATAPHLGRLCYLNVQNNALNDEAVTRISTASALPALIAFEYDDRFRKTPSAEATRLVTEAMAARNGLR